MAIKIEIINADPVTLSTTSDAQQVINVNQSPVIVNGTGVDSVAIEVLKGAPGDTKVYVGTVAPANPQEGWIWLDTSGG